MTAPRIVLLVLAALLIAAGTGVCILGPQHLVPRLVGIQMLFSGVAILLGTVFERWRYRNRLAAAAGDWKQTGERFVDPVSGKQVEVLFDARSGERRYQDVG